MQRCGRIDLVQSQLITKMSAVALLKIKKPNTLLNALR